MAARAQAYLFIAAGAVGTLGVLLPHPERYDVAGLLAIQCASFAAAALLLVLGGRTPDWVATCGPFGAAVLTSLAIVLTGTSTSAYLLFYMWVAFYAFYFLSRRQSAFLCLFAVLNYAAVVLGARLFGYTATGLDANQDIPAFVLITGTIVVAGVFLVRLRERVGRLIEQLTDAASTDPLTGLLNRRGFQSVIDNELARAERGGHTFSLLLCDCDFFKHLNDRLGHHAGDEALQAIGRLLDVNKRRIDVAARVGGEEFALVLPETDQHEAFIVAERLRSRFGQAFADQPVPLTMSLGVATYPVHGMTADALLRSSDEALYAAKSLGRDRTVLYSAEVQGILATRQPRGQRPRPRTARDGPQPRRGAGHARHRDGAPLPDRRALLRADGARAGPSRRAGRAGQGRRRAPRHRQDRRVGRDPAQAGPAHRRRVPPDEEAPRDRGADPRRIRPQRHPRAGSSPTTSGPTAGATRAGWATPTSRSRRRSSRSPTPTRR